MSVLINEACQWVPRENTDTMKGQYCMVVLHGDPCVNVHRTGQI